MSREKKRVPELGSEEEEREFGTEQDSTEFALSHLLSVALLNLRVRTGK